MHYHGAECGATHARVAEAHHVAYSALQQLFGQRQESPFGHARAALRPSVAHHKHVLRINIKVRDINAVFHIVMVVEDERPATMRQ